MKPTSEGGRAGRLRLREAAPALRAQLTVLSTLVPYLRRYRKPLTLGLVILLLRNLVSVTVPLALRQGVDALAHAFSFQLVLAFAGTMVALTAIKGALLYWMRVILIGVSREIEYELRNDLMAHLLGLCSHFYQRFRTGDIMARATNDLNAVRMMLGPGLMYSADTAATALFAIIVMLYFDWRLTLLALLPAPVVSVVVRHFGQEIHGRFQRIQQIFGDMSNRLQEDVVAVRIIRAYAQEEAEKRNFEELNRRYLEENLRLARLGASLQPLLHSLIGVSFLIVLAYGGYRVLSANLSIGTFMMFIVFLGMLIWPMIAVGWVVNLVQRGVASLERINELFRQQPVIRDPAVPRPLPSPLQGEIVFEDVRLRLGGTEVLRGVTLRIPAGATVAIVGQTGAGKSSLVRLIPRIWDPDEGRVLLDGIDVREFRLAQLRQVIGFVPQESFLFSGTLAENIAWGKPDATAEEIHRAAELAGLAPDVATFPQGYDTLIGERGITLSGGQKQRTTIARVILLDPKILILDDALSSVDTVTEEKILSNLAAFMRGRTTIWVSHRASAVRRADWVFVLDQGRLVEEGTPEELLARGGWYAELFRRQMLEQELESV